MTHMSFFHTKIKFNVTTPQRTFLSITNVRQALCVLAIQSLACDIQPKCSKLPIISIGHYDSARIHRLMAADRNRRGEAGG